MIWGWNELIMLNYSYLIQYNSKQERTITPFAGILQINEHFLPKACFSTLRGKRAKHAALMAINGSLTEINVEIQRAEHAQKRL